jgi:flavin reductase (DIM6/NTAB) family NADH-FMN oxidoreductase RutF
MNIQDFRSAMGCFVTGVTGVTVVTAIRNDGPVGVTANSFSSVSLDPPLVLWSVSVNSRKHQGMTEAKNYAINVLSKSQNEIALKFSGKPEPIFNLDTASGLGDVPLIENAVAVFECERHLVYKGGDHSIILGLVRSVKKSKLEPLTFLRGGFA